jgi:chromosome segregation ATPase
MEAEPTAGESAATPSTKDEEEPAIKEVRASLEKQIDRFKKIHDQFVEEEKKLLVLGQEQQLALRELSQNRSRLDEIKASFKKMEEDEEEIATRRVALLSTKSALSRLDMKLKDQEVVLDEKRRKLMEQQDALAAEAAAYEALLASG